jgi:hypothetical protein
MASRKTQEKLAKTVREEKAKREAEEAQAAEQYQTQMAREDPSKEDMLGAAIRTYNEVLASVQRREERLVSTLERIAGLLERLAPPETMVGAIEVIRYGEDLEEPAPAVELPRLRGEPPAGSLAETNPVAREAFKAAQPVPAARPDTVKGDVKLKDAQNAFLVALESEREHAIRVLRSFGVDRVSGIPASKYAAFIEALA